MVNWRDLPSSGNVLDSRPKGKLGRERIKQFMMDSANFMRESEGPDKHGRWDVPILWNEISDIIAGPGESSIINSIEELDGLLFGGDAEDPAFRAIAKMPPKKQRIALDLLNKYQSLLLRQTQEEFYQFQRESEARKAMEESRKSPPKSYPFQPIGKVGLPPGPRK